MQCGWRSAAHDNRATGGDEETMKKKTKIVILIVLILAAGAVLWFVSPGERKVDQAVESYTVARGDVEVTITGSGILEAKDTTEIKLPQGIEIDTIFVEKGDVVKAGDVLASLDASSLQVRAAELSAQMAALDRQLGTRQVQTVITTPVKGRVKYLPATEDDDVIETVNEHGALAILSTDGLMQVELKTNSVLALNADVTVKWSGGSDEGKVASRIENGYLITVSDEDAPYHGKANVYYDATLVGSGTLGIHAPLAIFGNGGTIDTNHVKVDANLSAGSKLFTLTNEPVTNTYRQTLADRNEAAEQLQTVLAYVNHPNVLASDSGTVNEICITEGKKTVSPDGSSETTAFVLGIGGATKMSVDVDELDINSVQVGQKATITLDAFSEENFQATVTRISHIGEPSGSITTYETDLELANDPRLMAGMNGSAVILAQSVSDVLTVPLGAVHEDENGSYVYLLDASDAQRKVYIQTGLSDGGYAEVKTGLAEGDRIVYSKPTHSITMMNGQTIDADTLKSVSPFGGMMND